MARTFGKLTSLAVSRMKDAGLYGDGGGLWLNVSKAQTKSWVFRFMLNGRARGMGLGPTDLVTLAEARSKAIECRKLLLDDIDPLEAKREKKQSQLEAAGRARTFEQCTKQYFESHNESWRNEKHREQWRTSLETYAFPLIGKLSVQTVDLTHVLAILQPLWHSKNETANRVRGRIEKILDSATARKLRSGDNPARWRGNLDAILPKRSKVQPVKHHAAMPIGEVPSFMASLREKKGASAQALQFLILTATRTSETLKARWSEIDFTTSIWTIPGERMKAGKTHEIPLSRRAIEILQEMEPLTKYEFNEINESSDPYIFPGAKQGKPLSNMAMISLLRKMKINAVVHGFRSTFRDWAGESTKNFSREVVEHSLAHQLRDRTEAAYFRSSLLSKRKELMAEWEKFCASDPIQLQPTKVIPLQGYEERI